ncbi:hypothetical protein A1Q2_03406 [Trichosporon asahii var. asahii CBS 8904]|uniref:Uncharacterized protein n=1 Tax=Trichosporon asahii var. asahii (strain CBS 8904) TaxID=1220162 RepID=K1WMA6_TRIAC|nr:hypothetical protein A1Q2_03406 [Trichosporon asahii var. asahii CBS 8904]
MPFGTLVIDGGAGGITAESTRGMDEYRRNGVLRCEAEIPSEGLGANRDGLGDGDRRSGTASRRPVSGVSDDSARWPAKARGRLIDHAPKPPGMCSAAQHSATCVDQVDKRMGQARQKRAGCCPDTDASGRPGIAARVVACRQIARHALARFRKWTRV